MHNTNQEWLYTLKQIAQYGELADPRGRECHEILQHKTVVDMNNPILTIPERKLGYKFMAAEAAWILSGDNRVSTIAPYSKMIKRFSDDGITYHGAYGPKIRDQIRYVARTLIQDNSSRQAVINIWRENPPETKDVPCTLSLQFVIRNGYLHCFDTMRSSDIWLGWPYDVFNMSMVSRYLIAYMKQIGAIVPQLGKLYLTAGSQHLYAAQADQAAKILSKYGVAEHDRDTDWFLPSSSFTPDQLVDWLWEVAEHGTLTTGD